MNFQGMELCCPHCREELERPREDALHCRGCGREFPVICGIPDLRVFPDPYIGIEEDRAKGRQLAEHFHEFRFEEFIDYYYANTSVVPPQHAQLYKRGLLAAAARAEDWLESWDAGAGGPGTALLDVGCGTAPLLLAAKNYRLRAGVDIAFRWLVVGKKRLAEAGLELPLLCACAEALPFRDAAFDRVVFDSALEHLRDQPASLAEAHRVLCPRGYVFLATPNRLSVGPDPQTGMWAGGWLPESWTASIVRRAGGIPPVRRLLSVFALRGLLRAARFSQVRISLPGIPARQRALFSPLMKTLIAIYDGVRRFPASRPLLRLVGPLLHATARKD